MPTSSDYINIAPVYRTSTVETWVARTNEIITDINTLQVADVDVGLSGGLKLETGMSGGNYNGVVTLSVNDGPGIRTRTFNDGQSRTVVDFGNMSRFGLDATAGLSGHFVGPNDEFLFNAASDYSGGPSASGNPATSGTVKKVKARNMFPSTIDVPSGGLNFNGNVVIGGTLTIQGNETYVASNNLRIEDTQFEIAYQVGVPMTVTGVTASSFTLGVTAYHFLTPSGLTPNIQAHIQAFTGPVAGPTGYLTVGYPFGDNQSADSFNGLTGYMSMSPTGSRRFSVQTIHSPVNAFLSDDLLSTAGMVAKGASSDKSFLWIYQDTDTGTNYNSWMSNTNLGVDSANSSIISRTFRSYGYTGINQSDFVFASEPSKTPSIYISTLNNTNTPLTFTGGTWKISKIAGNALQFSTGTTGLESVSSIFTIASGASGTTYSGITTTNFANGFNADMLDGAHAYRNASAYSIPVSDQFGRIDGAWLDASAVRKQYTSASHGLTVGSVVRYTPTGSITGAIATSGEYAETLGIVSSVESSGVVTVTTLGYVNGLSGARMTVEGSEFSAGNVYFLSAGVTGKLIADPDLASATRLSAGQIRKPMFLALSATAGMVLNYIGSKTPSPTDEVYLPGLVPVGVIQSFAGDPAYIPAEWLLCDGDSYRTLDYPDLYTVIGRTYYTNVVFGSTGLTGTVNGGSRSIAVGDIITLDGATAGVASINSSTGQIVVDRSITAGTKALNVYTNSGGQNLFFVPDLRTRYPLGGSTGSTAFTSAGLSGYTIGTFGGSESTTLSISQMPAHSHTLNASTIASSGVGSSTVVSGGGSISTSTTGGSSPVDLHSPYLVTNYIIRASRGIAATVLTGHNHDERYVRFDNAPTLQSTFGPSAGSTASNFRNKLGVYSMSEVYSKTESDVRYYLTADANTRFINNGGDSGISGTYTTIGNFLIDTNSDSTDTIGLRGIVNVFLANSGDGQGLNVLADSTILGDGSSTYSVLKVFANSSPTDTNSRTEVYVNGDFTVAGNYLSGNGISAHNNPVFGVDPLVSSVYISGGFTTGSGLAPSLVFTNGGLTPSAPIGFIRGLTAPSTDSDAVNKWYADKVDYFVSATAGLTGFTAGYTVSGLENGIWHIAVHGSTEPTLANGTPVTIGLTMNSEFVSLVVNDRDDANSTPISLSTVTTISGNQFTINSLQDMFVQRIVGFKLGKHT